MFRSGLAVFGVFSFLAAAVVATACATSVEAPGAAAGVGGGSGGSTDDATSGPATGTSLVGTGTGGAGGSAPCVHAEECADLTDACNTGVCINGACEKQPANEAASCDDGKQCTLASACQAGACVGTQLKACPSSGPCTLGTCDVDTDTCAEIPANDGQSCVDNDPCTLTGFCQAGLCAPGQQVDCSFLDTLCGQGICDPNLGCVAMPLNDGTPCDDGLFCTVNDVCGGGTCMGGAPNTCAPPGDVCLIGSCNEQQDTCVAVPGNNGGACDDQSTCTAGETCSNGVCGGGAPANQGGACDDGNACTTNDTCNAGACAGTAILACQNGDGCCAPGCNVNTDDDCKLVDVAIMEGDFYTDDLRLSLVGQPFIQSVVNIQDCSLATLSNYDVVVVYGNMFCFDDAAFSTYVQNGGGLIGTPWINANNGGVTALPVSPQGSGTVFSQPMSVQVTDASDVLLQGVSFVNGDAIGFEDMPFTLKPGATSSVIHMNDPTKFAVSKWSYGSGRGVMLNFHYITSDCSLASSYGWGKKLAYNAVLWAGKAIN